MTAEHAEHAETPVGLFRVFVLSGQLETMKRATKEA
jgi:hypothetical protein